MRISSLAPLLALTACGSQQGEAPSGDLIECALDGATEFAKVCTRELVDGGIVLHRPDGGFRRLQSNGANVRSADGAEPVEVTVIPTMGGFELKIGGDRYRTLLAAPTSDLAQP